MNKKDLIDNIKFLKITNSYVKDRKSIKFLLSLYHFEEKPFKIGVNRDRKRSNKSTLFSVLEDIMKTSKDDSVYLGSVRGHSHLNKVTIQQKLRKLEEKGYLKHIKMMGLSKVYEITKKGKLEYQKLQEMYEMKQI